MLNGCLPASQLRACPQQPLPEGVLRASRRDALKREPNCMSIHRNIHVSLCSSCRMPVHISCTFYGGGKCRDAPATVCCAYEHCSCSGVCAYALAKRWVRARRLRTALSDRRVCALLREREREHACNARGAVPCVCDLCYVCAVAWWPPLPAGGAVVV